MATTPREPTVIGRAAVTVVRVLASYGVDGRIVAQEAGVPDRVFDDPDKRFPSSILDRFFARAAEASGDPAFALVFAQQHRAISYHLYFAMAASETLADAWRRLARYQAMLSERLELGTLPGAAGERCVTFAVSEPEEGRWLPGDVLAAGQVIGARGFAMDASLSPRRLELRRPKPASTDAFDQLFQCPIRYGCERNVMVWDAAAMKRSLPLANPEVAAQTEGIVVDYMARWAQDDLPSQLRRMLLRQLPDGPPRRDDLARRLGKSPRSLARELAEARTSYRAVLDEVRTSLACDYLRAGASVTEVTFMLGFAETSSFCRAFRRWTGQSPSAFVAASKASKA